MLIVASVFLPAVSAPVIYLLGRHKKYSPIRDMFAAAVMVAVFSLTLLLVRGTWLHNNGIVSIQGILSGALTFQADGFRSIYALITAIMWLGTTLFSFEYFRHEQEGLARYWFFNLITLSATMGVMLSADFMTTFVFFEILSFTSFTWVIHEQTKEAIDAGYTYLFVAVIGGLILLMGLLLLQHTAGTLQFSQLHDAVSRSDDPAMLLAAGICILLGFGAKAGMFPLHIWLPKAHPIAPSPASALLSGILTKVGIYGILATAMNVLQENTFFGKLVLIIGLITMTLGALLAVFSVNLKRTLACSSMSQIGFILTGTGMFILLSGVESEEGAFTALSGLMLHMVNHSLIKLVLFMSAGVVVMNLHALELNAIRGWGRRKPMLKTAFALGALGISGVPLFNGFISKTLLHEGIVEGIHEYTAFAGFLHAAEWIFLFSGGLTFAYMLKLFICIFVEKNADAKKQAAFDQAGHYMNPLSGLTIFLSSLLMILLGQPAVMTRLAAFMTGNEEILSFQAFTMENLKGGFISLTIGALVYLLFIRLVTYRHSLASYVNLWPADLDLEKKLYRPLLTRILPGHFRPVVKAAGEHSILTPLCRSVLLLARILSHILCDGTDVLIMLLRKSVFREKHKVLKDADHISAFRSFEESAADTIGTLSGNFTFAMMMTCIGIITILVILIVLALL